MEANPSPAPNTTRMSESAMATAAPASIAPQEVAGAARARVASSKAYDAASVTMMRAQLCEHIASSSMIGRGTPSIHNKIPRPMFKTSCCVLKVLAVTLLNNE